MERWLPIVGYKGVYEVSDEGRVRSCERTVLRSGRCKRTGAPFTRRAPAALRKLSAGSEGYLLVDLWVNSRPKSHLVHRLVCEAFNGPPPFSGALSRHLNDIRTDNRPENLAWGSRLDNAWDARANGPMAMGLRHGHAKLTPEGVRDIRARLADGDGLADIARDHGVAGSTINSVRRGKTWAHVAPDEPSESKSDPQTPTPRQMVEG